MKVVKEYKRSVKLKCGKCKNNFVAVKGSRCADIGQCSRCTDEAPELIPAWLK